LKGEYRGNSQSFTGFPSNNYIVRVDPSFNYPFGSACGTSNPSCLALGVVNSPSGQPYPFPGNRAGNCADADGNGLGDCLFTVKWTGEIMADTTDTFTFTATADDFVKIWVNGNLVINQCCGGPQTGSGSVGMTANQWVPIEIQFTNNQWANDFLSVQWSAPSMTQRYLSTPNLRTVCP
jgi:hypothetical protein